MLGCVHRRELSISLLLDISGRHPSGLSILETFGKQQPGSLESFYREWQLWCVDVLLTHRSYPLLSYFRSADGSWLAALGAVLDSATLITIINDGPSVSEKLFLRSAQRLIEDLCLVLDLPNCCKKEIDSRDIDVLFDRLERAGFGEFSADQKDMFVSLRAQYIKPLTALCQHLALEQVSLLGAEHFFV